MKDSYPYSNPKLWPFWSLIVLSILILVSCLFNQYRAIFLYWAPYHVMSCIHAWHSIKHIKTLCCVVIFIAPGSYNLFMQFYIEYIAKSTHILTFNNELRSRWGQIQPKYTIRPHFQSDIQKKNISLFISVVCFLHLFM